MNPARRATFVLILLCVIWGSSFFSMDLALDGLAPEVGKAAAPMVFLLVRFAIATALLPILFPRSVRELTRASALSGAILAVPFTVGFMCGGSFGMGVPLGTWGVHMCAVSLHQLPAVQSASTLQPPGGMHRPLLLHTPERQTVGPLATVQGPSPLA